MFIYVITNSATLKIYIGQHKGASLKQYLQRKLSAAAHREASGSYLFASMRKHPKGVWSIHPLISDLQTRAECDHWETLLIRSLNSRHPDVGYNICRGGEGFTGPHSDATCRRLSEANMGHVVSEETRAKISEHTGFKPPEFGEKIRQALTGREWTAEQREKIPAGVKKAIREGRMKIHQFTSDELDRAHRAAAEKFTGVPRPIEHTAGMHTPEAKAKAHKNSAATRKGKKRPDIAIRKKSWWVSHPGHKFPLDRNAKISDTMKGKVPVEALKKAHSPETEEKRQNTRFLKTVAYG